jgi:hypothetical protein
MPKYPEDSIQYLAATDWWELDESRTICRGALVRTYVQYFSQVPLELTAQRVDAENHTVASFVARPLYADVKRGPAPSLPVAGFPNLEGADCHITNRAKKRPCLVIGAVDHKAIEKCLTHGMVKAATHEFFLVAPYYSVSQEGRSGYNPEFVDRIKHAEYSRFFWDDLPGSGHESILRFDQIQPVGFHHQAFEHLGYKLSQESLGYIDEWLSWMIYEKDGEKIAAFRGLVHSLE